MTGLLDGTNIPWYAISGHRDPDAPAKLPPPVRRDPQQPPLTMQQRATLVGRMGAAYDQLGNAAKLLAESLRRFK